MDFMKMFWQPIHDLNKFITRRHSLTKIQPRGNEHLQGIPVC